MNPHRLNSTRLEKLKSTSLAHQIVIGVDFDYTLVDSSNNYSLYPDIVSLLQEAQKVGFILCIWTANTNPSLVTTKWEEASLIWSYYNESPINPGKQKPHFNILLDDSAGLEQSMQLLKELITYKKEQHA